MVLHKNSLPFIFVMFLILISLIDGVVPGARYAKYIIVPFCLIISIYYYRRISFSPALLPFVLYVFISVLYVLVAFFSGGAYFYDDIFFMLAYALPFLLLNVRSDISVLFKFSVLFFLVAVSARLSSTFVFSFMDSESTFEHDEFGFIFALFFLFFYRDRNYKYAFFAAVISIFIMKRIALFGLCFSILVVNTRIIHEMNKTFLAIGAAFLNLAIIGLIKFSTTEQFSDAVYEVFGVGSNQLMMGRVVLYSYILDRVDISLFVGEGPGAVYDYASSAFGMASRMLLHSDILKIAIEFGFVVLWLFVFLLYRARQIPLEYAVFVNILMLTDNPLIYGGVMFFFLLFIFNSRVD